MIVTLPVMQHTLQAGFYLFLQPAVFLEKNPLNTPLFVQKNVALTGTFRHLSLSKNKKDPGPSKLNGELDREAGNKQNDPVGRRKDGKTVQPS